jgi:AraC-like DNA-binding protein
MTPNNQEMTAEQYPKIYLYRRIVAAKLFIDNNYADKIDLDNISDEAYFSKFHFIRLFKSAYGKTPHQYLKWVRIEKAQQLLKNDKGVSETCFMVGFESLTSFSGLFKRTVGESPSSYVARQRELRQKANESPFSYIPKCYAYQHGWLEK